MEKEENQENKVSEKYQMFRIWFNRCKKFGKI